MRKYWKQIVLSLAFLLLGVWAAFGQPKSVMVSSASIDGSDFVPVSDTPMLITDNAVVSTPLAINVNLESDDWEITGETWFRDGETTLGADVRVSYAEYSLGGRSYGMIGVEFVSEGIVFEYDGIIIKKT